MTHRLNATRLDCTNFSQLSRAIRRWGQASLLLTLLVLVSVACSGKKASKQDIDDYIRANIASQKDAETNLEVAKQLAKSSPQLAELGRAADTTADDVIGSLETKGVLRSQIDAILDKSPFKGSSMGSARSKLNWDPNGSDATPPPGVDPDAVLPVGPQQFASVVQRLKIAAKNLASLANGVPNDWSGPSTIAPKCQGPRHRRNVCIVQNSHYKQYWTEAAVGCDNAEKFLVNSPALIRSAFDKLDEDCVEIGSLKLISHGEPGNLAMGVSISNVDAEFLTTGPLFSPGAKIEIHGCSVGKSCLGSVLMLKMARKAFSQNAGTIVAPTVTTYFNKTVLNETFATDDKKSLAYAPTSNTGRWLDLRPRDRVESPQTLESSCGNEFTARIERIKKHVAAKCSFATVASSAETLDAIAAYAPRILALPERQLDNLRLRALADISDMLTIEVNELDLKCP